MQANSEPGAALLDDIEDRSATLVVQARWYSQTDAARILGISQTALRKRIASGELTSVRSGRSRRVLILGEGPAAGSGETEDAARAADAPAAGEPPAELSTAPSESDIRHQEMEVLSRTSESLASLVRELQRQSLALAGQIGYLQHELAQANERVQRLEQAASAPAKAVVTAEDHARLQADLEHARAELEHARAESNRPRRRWRFWRR